MTTLTEKLDELQIQWANEHTALLSVLGTIANVSDLLLTGQAAQTAALEAAIAGIPTSDAAVLTVLEASHLVHQDSNATLVGVANNTSTLISVIDALVAAIEAIPTDSTALLDSIGERGTPTADSVIGRMNTITAFIDEVIDRIGPNGDATGTVNAQLASIRDCVCLLASHLPGPPTTEPECEEYASCGVRYFIAVSELWGDVNVAKWCEPLPEGISYGTVFGLVELDVELDRVGGWGGVKIWVESDSPSFSLSPLSTQRYPTNTWLDLFGPDTISVSVGPLFGLKVYLCVPHIYCTQEEATEIHTENVYGGASTSTFSVAGYDGFWIGTSCHPATAGTLDLYIDGVLVFTITPIDDAGRNEFYQGVTGSVGYISVYGSPGFYTSISGCPSEE